MNRDFFKQRKIYSDPVSKYNPFIYKGYYYDEETELYYCNTGYYSPEIGRWISIDDVDYLDPESINGLNLYAYANNNPIGIAYSSSSVGYGWRLENGISISGGIIIGDTSHEITVSVGNGALLGYAVCGLVATLPAPGARALAGAAACVILLIDIFN